MELLINLLADGGIRAVGATEQFLGPAQAGCLEFVQQDEESEALAEEYIRQDVVSRRMLADAQHVAVATIAKVDVLVSWNFKHVVNLDRIHGFNAVNSSVGVSYVGDSVTSGGLER